VALASIAAVLAGVLAGVVVPAAGAAGGRDCGVDRSPVRDLTYRRVRGPGAGLTKLDVYPAPEGCATPVVVWVHGGGWRVGDKAQGQDDKIRLFGDLGATYVSVNYRLTDDDAAEPVRYPVHEEDVAAAVAWVHDHIARYGGDPDRIAVLGHSAGAQLVALLATDPRFLARHDLDLDALSCAAPLDTEGFDVTTAASAPGRQGRIYQSAFGTDPEVWRRASALGHVAAGAGIPPMLLVARGTPERRAAMQAFADALEAADVPVTVVEAGSYTHRQVNRSIGVDGEQVITPALTTFLRDCFAGDRPPSPRS
jgi:acetyl esterase/lipase